MNELAPTHADRSQPPVATIDVARVLTRRASAIAVLALSAIATTLELVARPSSLVVSTIETNALQDDRRMPITSGPNDGHDRVSLGRLEVR